MKLVFSYLKEHMKWITLYVTSIFLMMIVFVCSNNEHSEILYGFFITLFLLVAFLGIDMFVAIRRQLRLQKMEAYIENIVEYLEEPKSVEEEAYQKLIRQLDNEKTRYENEATAKMTDLREYYTMWVHQIKTPIAALRLLLQEKASEVDTQEEQDELFRIEQYVEMALQYMRLDSESTDFVIKRVELDEVLKEAIHKYARLFIRKKVKLQYDKVNVQVLSDKKWLGFVVEQILSNAIKYAKGGCVSIYMQGERTLIIEDNGIGIRAEDLPRVMEKGYTGYNGHNHKHSTGIGLYLCNRIMMKMNHRIRIESEEGKGTRVVLSFPKSQEESYLR